MQVHSLDTPTTRVTLANKYFFMNQKLCPTIQHLTTFTVSSTISIFQEGMVSGRGRTGTSANWNRLHLGLQLQTSTSSPDSTHRQKRQHTPVFLPGKSHGQRSLLGYSPYGQKESDMTGWLNNRVLTDNSLPTSHWAKSCNYISSTSSYHNPGISIFHMQERTGIKRFNDKAQVIWLIRANTNRIGGPGSVTVTQSGVWLFVAQKPIKRPSW